MRFKRIDNNSIRCIISQEEMDAHGIAIDDLMDDRHKAETFLRYILQQAHDVLNFEMTGNVLNVQLSVMPGGDVALMITDNDHSALRNILNQFRDSLRLMKEAMEEKQSGLAELKNIVGRELEERRTGKTESARIVEQGLPDKSRFGREGAEAPFDSIVWAEIPTLEQTITMAKTMEILQDRPSSLYKYHDIYYLRIDMKSTRKGAASLAFSVSEYANSVYAENSSAYDVIEHGTLIIAEDALSTLAAL